MTETKKGPNKAAALAKKIAARLAEETKGEFFLLKLTGGSQTVLCRNVGGAPVFIHGPGRQVDLVNYTEGWLDGLKIQKGSVVEALLETLDEEAPAAEPGPAEQEEAEPANLETGAEPETEPGQPVEYEEDPDADPFL